MIRTRDLVPNIYYDKSRDFQAIGRTFEVIYNYAKTNTDLVLNSYEDVKMLDLLAKTIGFNSKHNYNTEDLYTLCNTFIWILKNKGSKKSVEMAVTAMLNAQHIDERDFLVVDAVDENKNKLYELDIYISKELTDLILLEDLFEYILPTGYAYRFIPAKFIRDLHMTYAYIEHISNMQSYAMPNLSYVAVVEGSKANISMPTINTTSSSKVGGISYANVVFVPQNI